jgi:hypothetical protein
MDKKILILVAIFLFSLSSVYAIDIDSCMVINTSDYYKFIGNITSNTTFCSSYESSYSCIVINASDVTLDLNGKSLINNGSCHYGIRILPKNETDPTDVYDNIKIMHGFIPDGFDTSGILVEGVSNAEFSQLSIYNSVYDGILFNTGYNPSITINNNYIETNLQPIHLNCTSDCNIHDNIIYSNNYLWLSGNDLDIEKNKLGYYTDNLTTCFRDYYPSQKGLQCDGCSDSLIINNEFLSYLPVDIKDTQNVNMTDNMFEMFYNYNIGDIPLAYYETGTSYNYFCNNEVFQYKPTLIDGICYIKTSSSNAYLYTDSKGSNEITRYCSNNCIAGSRCEDNYKIYMNTSCHIVTNSSCEYGCDKTIYGTTCIGNLFPTGSTTTTVLTEKWNISYDNPVMNQTDLQEAGLNFLIPFFTPTFLVIMFEIIVSSIIAWISRQKMAFPITIFIMTALMGVYGIFSMGITLLICIITALSTALMFKGLAK